jgi:hypothetical protein
VGVPTARGHGVMEVQRFETPMRVPNSVMILAAAAAQVDRPKGSIRPGTFVPRMRFAGHSLASAGIAPGNAR